MIIYVPGTGGSFLRRALSLNQCAVVSDANQAIATQEKFRLFNDWSPTKWKLAENRFRPLYRTGEQDFYKFEQSDLWLIDAWHPDEFITTDDNGSCWVPNTWPGFVFINAADHHRSFIEQQQQNKGYMANWSIEQQQFRKIKDQYGTQAHELTFDDLLDCELFLKQIVQIDQKFELGLDLELVEQLWNNWYASSVKAWKTN